MVKQIKSSQKKDNKSKNPLLEDEKQYSDEKQDQKVEAQSPDSSVSPEEPIIPAIKTMQFRKKRGTNIKDLMTGKNRKDQFWEIHQKYFGGKILSLEDQDDDEEDYQMSSSGRDEFDSDFDLTDSYVGKRGRKKGTKIRKRIKRKSKKNIQLQQKLQKEGKHESNDKKNIETKKQRNKTSKR